MQLSVPMNPTIARQVAMMPRVLGVRVMGWVEANERQQLHARLVAQWCANRGASARAQATERASIIRLSCSYGEQPPGQRLCDR